MRIRLIELGVVVVVQPGEIDDVTDVITELGGGRGVRYLGNHLLRDIVLEFAVLDAAGISHDMEHHLFRGLKIISDRGEMVS